MSSGEVKPLSEPPTAPPASPDSSCSPRFWISGGEGCFGAQFTVGVQTFAVGPQDYPTIEEAEWMRDQFKKAFFRANRGIIGHSRENG